MMCEILWSFLVLSIWLKKIMSFTTSGVYVNIFFFNHTLKMISFSNCWIIFKINECESCIAVEKYWKISLVVMVSLMASATCDKFNIFSWYFPILFDSHAWLLHSYFESEDVKTAQLKVKSTTYSLNFEMN